MRTLTGKPTGTRSGQLTVSSDASKMELTSTVAYAWSASTPGPDPDPPLHQQNLPNDSMPVSGSTRHHRTKISPKIHGNHPSVLLISTRHHRTKISPKIHGNHPSALVYFRTRCELANLPKVTSLPSPTPLRLSHPTNPQAAQARLSPPRPRNPKKALRPPPPASTKDPPPIAKTP